MMVFPTTKPTTSYWIEGAESPLRDFRSTSELPSQVDVVIIGSGYTGATAAYWLDKMSPEGSTPSMLMLEARDICGGATGRNGGQLRPHLYSRYPPWAERFGANTAHALIAHENAHLTAFKELLEGEGIAEEVCFKLDETFDAAMSDEAWHRLKGAYEAMEKDHGADDAIVKSCRLIENSSEAEAFTQMKGTLAAVVHPSAQVPADPGRWAYKFVHALLRIVMKTGRLNLQAHTPVTSVSSRDEDGFIMVHTERGTVKTRKVIHATNRWAGQLLPDYQNIILTGRGTLAALKAPEGFIKHTGAQHWDHIINNYHLQLPPPYNHIIIGGAKPHTVHDPSLYIGNDDEETQMLGVPEFYHQWAAKDVAGWQGETFTEFAKPDQEGGVWTGLYSVSIDGFPFVGAVPGQEGQYISAGYSGHGMPRILGSTAYIAPMVLESLGIPVVPSPIASKFPPLPDPYKVTIGRLLDLKHADPEAYFKAEIENNLLSSKKLFARPS